MSLQERIGEVAWRGLPGRDSVHSVYTHWEDTERCVGHWSRLICTHESAARLDEHRQRTADQICCDVQCNKLIQMQQWSDEFDGQVPPRLPAERSSLRQQLEELDGLPQECETHQEQLTRERGQAHAQLDEATTKMNKELATAERAHNDNHGRHHNSVTSASAELDRSSRRSSRS